jgi:antitoxin CptB
MPEAELDHFEALLDAPDQEVYAWLRGEARAPAEFETAVLDRMKALCARKTPTWNV